jgi:rod shape-determining protein MreD
MRAAAFLSFGVLLLLIQGNLYRVLGPLAPSMDAGGLERALGVFSATPNLVLPLVIFLGVQEASVARGATVSFALGHLVDLLASAPLYLFTFVSVALWGLARALGVRLTTQGALSRIPLVFGFCVVEGAVVLTLLAIFGTDNRRPVELLAVLLPRALTTALCAPLVFRVAQRLHLGTAAVRPTEGGGA